MRNAIRHTALAASLFMAFTLGFGGAPALAYGPGFYLPDLTFPTDQTVTGSTKGCTQNANPKAEAPATCH